jgi:4-hydroxy-3-methylbut-2-en-1-yl diphosphate reductase
MKILRASHLGMCFGVRDAIALAQREARHEPISVYGDLVHNPTVLRRLHAQGVQIERQAAAISTATVMITAHGASERARNQLAARGLRVLEATCPLVHAAHRAVIRLVRDGYHPVIIGKRDHVEVRGLTEDLPEFDVVLTPEDIEVLPAKSRFGIAAQTTQPIGRVREMVGLIRQRFPQAETRFIDTVCQPTKLRQHAAEEIAQHSDVVIVIGGADSNNTRELVATCGKFCPQVHHVQVAEDLRPEWFQDAMTVGVTAGTSTPDDVIDAVEEQLRAMADSMARHPKSAALEIA